jgi:hypothetical protein
MSEFTWNDLAEAISKLPEEQRTKKVFLAIDDESTFRKIDGLEIIPEDVYINKEDNDDGGPLEELKELYGEDFKEEDYRLSTPKGTPFLWTDIDN